MKTHRMWFSFAILLLAPALAGLAADKDRYGDPLPAGAKARLGTDRMRNEFGWLAGVLTPDGKHLAVFEGFKPVLLDVATGHKAAEIGHHPSIISADGKRAASAAGIVRVWEYPNGKTRQLTKRQFSNTALDPVSLSGDGKLVAIGAQGASFGEPTALTALVWDVDADKQVVEVTAEQNSLVGVRISPDGKTLATFGRHNDPKRRFGARNADGWPEQAVQLWNVVDGKPLARVAMRGQMVMAISFSPDSSLLAISAGDGLISLRDARTGEEKRAIFGRSFIGSHLAFAPDGKTLAAAGRDGRVQRWSMADGKMLGSTEPPVGPWVRNLLTRDLVFTGPDRAVAWGVGGSIAVVWEIPSGKLLSPAGGNARMVTSVAFTADSKHIITTTESSIMKWDANTGAEVAPVRIHPAWSGYYGEPRVRVLPGGTRAISNLTGSSVFDLTAETELFRLPVLQNSRSSGYAFHTSADGTKAVTRLSAADGDKKDRYEVWDLVAPKKLGEAEATPTQWSVAGVSDDGSKLFLLTPWGGEDRNLTGFVVESGKQLAVARLPGAVSAAPVPGTAPLALVPTKAGKFEVVNFQTGKTTATLDAGRPDPTGRPVFAPNGKSFAVAFFKDATGRTKLTDEVRVYSWPKGELLHSFTGHSGGVVCLAFSPDGKSLASGSRDTSVLVWDLTTTVKQK